MNRLRAISQMIRPSLPFWGDWSTGFFAGTLLLLAFARLRLALGTSPEVIIALLLTGTLAAMTTLSFIRSQHRAFLLGACWLIACWSLLQPAILEVALQSVRQFTVNQLTSFFTQFSVIFAVVLATFYPLLCGISIVITQRQVRRNAFMGGLATAAFALPLLIPSWITFNSLLWICVGCLIVAGAIYFSRTASPSMVTMSSGFVSTTLLEQTIFAALLGFALAIAMFIARQLTLNNLTTEYALAGGFLAGLCGGGILFRSHSPSTRWFALAVWAGGLTLLYPQLSLGALAATAWISQTWLLFFARMLLIALITFPLGAVLRLPAPSQTIPPAHLAVALLGGTLGFSTAIWSGINPPAAMLIVAAISVLTGVGSFYLHGDHLPRTWVSKASLASSCAVIVCGLLFQSRLDPARSEKLIYSGNAFAAFRNGTDMDVLNWLDDSRLDHEIANLEGRWSFWKQRGAQVVVRQNGLITEMHSQNTTICPESASELLPGLFALVAHPTAEHVLVLGVHSSTLKACESYPLRSVTVVDGTSHFKQVEQWTRAALTDQSRFHFVHTDVPLALKATHHQTYDVIVAPRTTPATTDGISQLSQDFYKDVQQLLSQNGIFCQRLAFYDLGPQVVRQLLATAKSIFPQVMILESVPGEMLLVGTQRTAPLVDADLIDRLQLPQTRVALGKIGWDWSIPASRGSLDHAAIEEWVAEDAVPFSQNNPQIAFELPREIARWDAKSQQTRQELAKYGMALGGHLGEQTDRGLDITQRLEDLQLAQRILSDNPDQVWGYRAALKQQLSDRPRSKILQVKGEGLKRRLHPDDQRRKDYLLALSRLAKADTPTVEMVDQLVSFVTPYDPLLGTFVSHEAFHQLKRVEAPTESAQLHNLLYTIYFSTPADKSVRNVCEAINILCEHPEIFSRPEDNWDHLNGLCEALRHRWHLRFYDSKETQYESIDTERSIAAIERALGSMAEYAESAGLTEKDWEQRSEVIELNLLRPLKQHRSKQLRRYQLNPQATGNPSPAG